MNNYKNNGLNTLTSDIKKLVPLTNHIQRELHLKKFYNYSSDSLNSIYLKINEIKKLFNDKI